MLPGGVGSQPVRVSLLLELYPRWVTQWHNIVAWGKKAELIEKYVKKGQLLAIEGKLINKVMTDLNGKKSKLTQVQVEDVLLINEQQKTA